MIRGKKEYYSINEIRAIEDNAFAMGCTVYELMENAGKAVADAIISHYSNEHPIVLLAGYGNNGGDGLVATRHLVKEGYQCKIFLVGSKKRFRSASSQKNYEELRKLVNEENWHKIDSEVNLEELKKAITSETIIIDALLGIGIMGVPKEPYYSVIKLLNEVNNPIIAVDIPSGYNPDSKNEFYIHNPKVIVCMGKNKVKKGDFPESEIIVADIGIPDKAEAFVGLGDLKWFLPRRKENSHKRDNGVIVVIGGSIDFIGAPVLSALGAFRTGADLVFLVVPKFARTTVNSFSPDFITYNVSKDWIDGEVIEKIVKDDRMRGATYVIGPGMLNDEKTYEAVERLLQTENKLKIVLDAGALSVLDKKLLAMLKQHKTILTPHKGEFYRLFNERVPEDYDKATKIVMTKAAEYHTTILLKGQHDIITDGERLKINITGHPGMTVGGTGDVLTGITAELLALIDDPFISASLAAYISGKAGELAGEKFGDGLMASDIPNYIYTTINQAKNFIPKDFRE